MRTLGIIALIAALATPVAALTIVDFMSGNSGETSHASRELSENKSDGQKHKKNAPRNGASPIHNEILDTQIG